MNYNICNEERYANLISNIEAMLALCHRLKNNPNEDVRQFIESSTMKQFYKTKGKKGTITRMYIGDTEKNESVYFCKKDEKYIPRDWLWNATEKMFPKNSLSTFPDFYIPCTTEEVMYLKYFLDEGYLNYFLFPNEVDKIDKKIDLYLSNCGIDSKTEYDKMREFIVMKGRSNLRENWDEDTIIQYHKNQKLILSAISKEKGKAKAIEYTLNGQERCVMYPVAMVYSQLEERIRIKGYRPDKVQYVREYLSEMKDVCVSSDTIMSLPKEQERCIVLAVKDKDNAKERLYSRLMEYEVVHLKDYRDNRDEKISFILLTYPEIDHKRIRNRLMDIMANVRVIDEAKIISELRRRNVNLSIPWPIELGTDRVSEDGKKMKNEILDIVKKRILQEEEVLRKM